MRIYNCFFLNKINKLDFCKISAVSEKEVLILFNNIGFKLIDVRKEFFYFYKYIFNDYKKIYEWFDLLNNLLSNGMKLDESLLIISKINGYEFSQLIYYLVLSGYDFVLCIERVAFFFGEHCVDLIKMLSIFLNIKEICEFVSIHYKKLHTNRALVISNILPVMFDFFISCFLIYIFLFFIKNQTINICLDFKIEIPLVIKIFIFMQHYYYLLILIIIIFCLIIKYYINSLPIFLHRETYLLFTYLSCSIKSGVKIIAAIDLFIQNTNVIYFKQSLIKIKNNLLNGYSISKSVAHISFLKKYSNLIRIGEEIARLTYVFESIANKEQDIYNNCINNFTIYFPKALYIFNVFIILSIFGSILISLYKSTNFNF